MKCSVFFLHCPLRTVVIGLFALTLSLSVLFCSSCSNIKSKRVTEQNKEQILNEIPTSKDLTDEDRKLLIGYVMRQSMTRVLQGAKPGLPVGKTLAEILEDQRNWIAQEKQEEERQKQLAAAVAAKQAELRNTVGVALYSFVSKQQGFMPYAEAGYAYENRSMKGIRAFEGRVVYKDVLGNTLEDVPLKVLTPIKAGEKGEASDNLALMADGSLRDKKLDDLKIEWQPKKILFADGTSAEVVSQQ